MADGPKEYGPTGCADGCAKTMSGTAVLLTVVLVLFGRLWKGRRRG